MLQPKLISVTPEDNYRLRLEYENSEKKLFDVSPYITGNWYSELKDVNYFRSVKVISGGNGIEWAHGQDIAPHELYELSRPL